MQNRLEATSNVRVKELRNGVKSYNFTRETFWKGLWDADTITARGLFMRDGEVLARGFEKFFNMNEPNGYTHEEILDFDYPVVVEEKLNGFLAIVSVIDDEVWVLSKSGETDFSEAAKRVLPMEALDEYRGLLHGWSLVFEVMLENDPHIVGYENEHSVLLAAIENTEKFTVGKASTLANIAATLGVPVAKAKVANDRGELEVLLDEAVSSTETEGVVIRDAAGRMSKIKSDWYSEVKRCRTSINRYFKNGTIDANMERILEFMMERGIEEGDLIVEGITGRSVNLPVIADAFR